MTNTLPQLSAVVTAHSEGRLLRPTLNSVHISLELLHARSGVDCEFIIVLDKASPETTKQAERFLAELPAALNGRTICTTLGESGLARNAGIREATGKYVGLVDGDDLISANYFTNSIDLLEQSDELTIVHPEVVVSFGARSVYWKVRSTTDYDISYRNLVEHNLWPSSCVAPRQTLLQNPYSSLHPESGFGPEDWFWNIETTIAGIKHQTAPGTTFMYRVRERGGVNNRHAHSILPWFDFDALRHALPFTSTSAVAKIDTQQHSFLRRTVRSASRGISPFFRLSMSWLNESIQARSRHAIHTAYQRIFHIQIDENRREPASAQLIENLEQLSDLEPAISWTAARINECEIWEPLSSGYANFLEEAWEGLRGKTAIVAVPWVGVGGADLVSVNYAHALADSSEFSGKTAFLATHSPSRTMPELIPSSVAFQQIDPGWRSLHPNQQLRLLAQILILTQPTLVVSVNCFDLTAAMNHFGSQIAEKTRIFMTLFAWDKIGHGYPTNPITDDYHRDFLDDIEGLITDNTTTAALIENRLGLTGEKVRVHRQPAQRTLPDLSRTNRAYTDEVFSEAQPFRIVWPHRLDKEKRPDTLPSLMRELRSRGLHVALDIWGQRVLNNSDDTLMESLEAEGIEYRGPYQGGLPGLDTHDYHSLLLTSESEGLPLVLVQALLAGLPVVASAVGGVPNVIIENETGLTSAGPDDTKGFADAIEQLYRSITLRQHLIETGHLFAVKHHSWESFAQQVRDDIIV